MAKLELKYINGVRKTIDLFRCDCGRLLTGERIRRGECQGHRQITDAVHLSLVEKAGLMLGLIA